LPLNSQLVSDHPVTGQIIADQHLDVILLDQWAEPGEQHGRIAFILKGEIAYLSTPHVNGNQHPISPTSQAHARAIHSEHADLSRR
jgi:hypothetical protein